MVTSIDHTKVMMVLSRMYHWTHKPEVRALYNSTQLKVYNLYICTYVLLHGVSVIVYYFQLYNECIELILSCSSCAINVHLSLLMCTAALERSLGDVCMCI